MKEIGEELEDLQHEVGGYIEAVYPFEDEVAIVCNEEGKLEGLDLNRSLRGDDGEIYDTDVEVTLSIYTHLTKFKEEQAIQKLDEHIREKKNEPVKRLLHVL